MNEEERLAIAKERIEFILKTYDVKIYDSDYEGIVIQCKNSEDKKRVSIVDNGLEYVS